VTDRITLTDAELREITGYKRAKEQRRYFDALAVPVSVRPDGSLCVVRAHLLNLQPAQAQNGDSKRVRIVRRAA
jgi:hypothetical protein